MKLVARFTVGAVLAAIAWTAQPAAAQDPVKVGPTIYKVVLENERVRVSEIHFAPGAKMPMHEHPDHFVYMMSDGKLKLSYPDGHSQEMDVHPGQTVWMNAETHAGENIGTTDVRGLVVELKPLPNYSDAGSATQP